MQDVIMGNRGDEVYGNSLLSTQFFCKPKTGPKNSLLVFLKNEWMAGKGDRSQLKLGGQTRTQIRKKTTLQIAVWGN